MSTHGGLQRIVAALTVVAVAFAVGTAAAADVGVGSWTPTGPMPQAWAGGSAVALSNGRVLAVAGDAEHTSTDLYDPNTGAWTEGPDIPVHAQNSTLVALAGGEALLIGGAVCTGEGIADSRCIPTATAFRLSSSGSAWTPVAPMLEARAKPTAVRLADGRVLVAGGFGQNCPPMVAYGYSCQPLATTEIYDPTSGRWSTTAPMPRAGGGASATLLSDGTVLVVGGYEGREAVRYDALTGIWAAAGETATPRTGSLLFALPGDRALALEGDEPYAGFFGSLGTAASALPPRCNPSSETFEAAFNAWTISLTEPAGSIFCPNGALLAGGQILLTSVGNPTLSGLVLTSPFLLDARQRCWSTTAPPIVERDEAAVVALPDGRALVFGGYGSTGGVPPLLSSEIYVPGSPTCGEQAGRPPESPYRQLGPGRFTGARITPGLRLTLTVGGSIRVPVQCPASATRRCLGHVRLALVLSSAGAKGRRRPTNLFLGDAPFAILAGKTGVVIVRVTKSKRALAELLRRPGGVTIVVSTSAYEEAGRTATTTASVTLREQLRHKHQRRRPLLVVYPTLPTRR